MVGIYACDLRKTSPISLISCCKNILFHWINAFLILKFLFGQSQTPTAVIHLSFIQFCFTSVKLRSSLGLRHTVAVVIPRDHFFCLFFVFIFVYFWNSSTHFVCLRFVLHLDREKENNLDKE